MASHFIYDDKYEHALDKRTGLFWQRCTMGNKPGSKCRSGFQNKYSQDKALNICNNIHYQGVSWRLPTAAELKAIVDRSRKNPSIDTTAFPNTPSDGFWTATPGVAIRFTTGNEVNMPKHTAYYVRCVAGPF